ncbi:hypothetical protein ACTXT7_006193 [Hymenolepis weldensis]
MPLAEVPWEVETSKINVHILELGVATRPDIPVPQLQDLAPGFQGKCADQFVEEQNTFFDDESMTDSELTYLFGDVRKIEDNENETATLPSKGKVAALIEFFESLQKEPQEKKRARRVRNSNLNIASDQQSTDIKVNELKDQIKTSSAEIICIPLQTADAQLVITTTSSVSDLAASSDQSTHLFKPHTSKLTLMYVLHRSMPNLKVTFTSRKTTAPTDGLVGSAVRFCDDSEQMKQCTVVHDSSHRRE